MSNFDLHEFNILSQRHNYFMTNNRINGFPVLKDSSIFLQKILSQRMSNSTDKKKCNNLLDQKNIEGFKYNKIRIYQSPDVTNTRINTDNNFNIDSIKVNNNRIINSNQNINIISPQRTENDILLMNRIVTPTYYKIPINITNRLSKSPNIGEHFNINDKLDNEVRVLNFGGKKIFASNSFNGLKGNDSKGNNNEKKIENSELFRNYDELKKKRDEIFKRKMKRDSSMYRKELLKKQKDKEIKEQTISINLATSKDKLRIIPLKKRLITNIKYNTRFNSNENIPKNKKNNLNNNMNNQSHNIIVLQKSKNLYSKKKFKTNNIFVSKNIKNKDKSNNNVRQINQKIKENLEYLRTKNKKLKTLANNTDKIIINIDNNIDNNQPEFQSRNKKFVEDYNPNITQIIYSNDRKVSIKMHSLKDKNVTTFPKEKKYDQKYLQVQKLISIFYKCSKHKSENNAKTKNKKMVRRFKNTNNDALSSIKEEEEKSKQESIIKDKEKSNNDKKFNKIEIKEENKKEKERPVSAFGGGVRSRYINRFHKK